MYLYLQTVILQLLTWSTHPGNGRPRYSSPMTHRRLSTHVTLVYTFEPENATGIIECAWTGLWDPPVDFICIFNCKF